MDLLLPPGLYSGHSATRACQKCCHRDWPGLKEKAAKSIASNHDGPSDFGAAWLKEEN
jgi:hypothetical protein